MNECKVISPVLASAVTFRAEGTGFDTCYLPFFLLCFIKLCYGKEEFDIDCSLGTLKG